MPLLYLHRVPNTRTLTHIHIYPTHSHTYTFTLHTHTHTHLPYTLTHILIYPTHSHTNIHTYTRTHTHTQVLLRVRGRLDPLRHYHRKNMPVLRQLDVLETALSRVL